MNETAPPPVYWHPEYGLIVQARRESPHAAIHWVRVSDRYTLDAPPAGSLMLGLRGSDRPVVAQRVSVREFLADRADELREALTTRMREQSWRGQAAEQIAVVGSLSPAVVLTQVDLLVARHMPDATRLPYCVDLGCLARAERWPCTAITGAAELFNMHPDYAGEGWTS
jgi:hypothetical protein